MNGSRTFQQRLRYKHFVKLSEDQDDLPYLRIAWAYLRTKEYSSGIEVLEKAITIYDENAETLDSAEKYLKKTLSINSEHTEASFAIGRVI